MRLPESDILGPPEEPPLARTDVQNRAKVLAGILGASIGQALETKQDTAQLAQLQDTVLGQLSHSVTMMAKIHAMTQPIQAQLTTQLATLPRSAQKAAKKVLGRLTALDRQTSKAIALGENLADARNSTPDVQADAIAALTGGMKTISTEVQPASLESKLGLLMRHIGKQLHRDLSAARTQGSSRAALDMKLYHAVKNTAKRILGLQKAAASAHEQAADDETRRVVRKFTQAGMKHELLNLQSEVKQLKQSATPARPVSHLQQSAAAAAPHFFPEPDENLDLPDTSDTDEDDITPHIARDLGDEDLSSDWDLEDSPHLHDAEPPPEISGEIDDPDHSDEMPDMEESSEPPLPDAGPDLETNGDKIPDPFPEEEPEGFAEDAPAMEGLSEHMSEEHDEPTEAPEPPPRPTVSKVDNWLDSVVQKEEAKEEEYTQNRESGGGGDPLSQSWMDFRMDSAKDGMENMQKMMNNFRGPNGEKMNGNVTAGFGGMFKKMEGMMKKYKAHDEKGSDKDLNDVMNSMQKMTGGKMNNEMKKSMTGFYKQLRHQQPGLHRHDDDASK